MINAEKKAYSLEEYSSEELFKLYRSTGRLDIKQELAMRYLYIIKSIALQMRGVYLSFEQVDDIINEGVIMLMRAIDKYADDKNTKFETYLSKRIRGMIIDIARKHDFVPRSIRKSYKDICDASANYFAQHGENATDIQIAEMLGLDLEKYYHIMEKSNMIAILSLDMEIEESDEHKKVLQVASKETHERPEDEFLNKELKSVLASGIKTLTEKEQMIISLYYVEEINMKEIAKVLSISEPRVSQLHSNAIRKLRQYIQNS